MKSFKFVVMSYCFVFLFIGVHAVNAWHHFLPQHSYVGSTRNSPERKMSDDLLDRLQLSTKKLKIFQQMFK
jgi:hypothetical protein